MGQISSNSNEWFSRNRRISKKSIFNSITMFSTYFACNAFTCNWVPSQLFNQRLPEFLKSKDKWHNCIHVTHGTTRIAIIFIIGDKEELMKERMRLEKAKKNGKQPERGAEKKRKNPDGSSTELQQHEKSRKQNDDKENEQRAKEKEAKKRKKEEEKQRQDLLLQTRKSQAAARWASASPLSNNNHQMEEVTILGELNPIAAAGFTPLPICGRNSTTCTQARVSPASKEQDECFDDSAQTPTGGQKTCSSLPPSKQKKGTTPFNSPHSASSNSNSSALSIASTFKESTQPSEETPRRSSNKQKSDCDPRRGLHFQSSMVDSSSEEEDTEYCTEDNPEVAHGNCCKEQQLENEALRKRIQKLHRRLNIACM